MQVVARFLLASVLLILGIVASAQEVVWSVDFNSVFSNREGGDDMRPDQTFIFTRLSPEVGMSLKSDSTGTHLLKGGVTWFQPLNDNLEGCKVLPTLYYQFQSSQGWKVAVGTMPRSLLAERLPRYLWSDSMSYHHPNVRGTIVQYRHGRSYGEFFLDWRQMQTLRHREAFHVVFDGKCYPWATGGSWLGGYVQYNHLAKRKNAPAGEGVNDDLTLNPMLGHDWQWGAQGSNWLRLKAGAIVNVERARCDGKWLTASGVVGGAWLRWHFLDVEQNLYAGSDLFPLYGRFGSLLNLGDTYYRDNFYSCSDVTAHIVHNSVVDLSASLTFHATSHITGLWQQLACRVYIDNIFWKNRHNRSLMKKRRLQSNY